MKRYVIIGTQHYHHRFSVGTVVELQREINPDSWAVVSVHSVPVLFSGVPRKLEQIVHPEDCRPWPQVGDEVIIPQGTVLLGANGEPIRTEGFSPASPVECRGRVVDIDPDLNPDPIPYKVELVGEPVEDDRFWCFCRRQRWFSADQLQPPVPAPIPVPVAPGHNPAGLTVAQVGEGWRLLATDEIRSKTPSPDDWYSIQCWLVGAKRWDNTGWSGDSDALTYRTQRPVGYFLPWPEVKPESPSPKGGDEVIIPKGTSPTPEPVAACPFKVGDAVWVPAGNAIPGVGIVQRKCIAAVVDLDASPGRVRIRLDGIAAGLSGYKEADGLQHPDFYVPFRGLEPVR